MDRQQHRRPRSLALHALVVTLLLALPSAAADPEPSASPPLEKGTLSGTVVGPGGRPVAGARVTLDPRSRGHLPIAETTTEANGRFRLGPLDPFYRNTRYQLRVEADGLAPAASDLFTFSVFPGADNDLGTFRLGRGRTFTGQVLNSDGKPVVGAAVEYAAYRRLTPGPYSSDPIIPARTVTTDADGRFRTLLLPVAFLEVHVRAEGYAHGRWEPRPIRSGGEEALEPIRLEPDVPITGVVVDDQGRPIEGLQVTPGTGDELTTNQAGRFVIRGHGRTVKTDMYFWKLGYLHATRHVERNHKGLWLAEHAPTDEPVYRPVEELRVVMQAFSRIMGRAVDDETGQPVRVDRVVLCFCERKPNGELVLSGCSADALEQPEPGRFAVPYGEPAEYHLTLSAAGYHDGEAFVPKRERLEPIDVGVVRLRSKKAGTKPTVARQEIVGMVTRDGVPMKTGWVGLWRLRDVATMGQIMLSRGRTVNRLWPIVYSSAPIRDGRYVLEVPFQHDEWYVVAEEPGRAPTLLGPLTVGVNERKAMDIACVAGGTISGRVTGIPSEWAEDGWVVAFDQTGVQMVVPVGADGEFRLDRLPPGEYGLKVGHEAYRDAEAIEPSKVPPETRGKPTDAWKRASAVRVEPGRETENVSLELPPE